MAAEEPLADGHLRFRFALTRSQRVVVQGQGWVEVAPQLAQFVGSTDFHLGFGKSMEGGLFDIDTGGVEIEREESLRNVHLGKFSG